MDTDESGIPIDLDTLGRDTSEDSSGFAGIPIINPGDIEGAPEQVRTRRGRKPGSKNKSNRPAPALQANIEGLETILLSLHGMGAAFFKTEELELDPKEAKSLAEGMAKVARHYGSGGMSEKTVDWLNLFLVLGTVYGTRVKAINIRKKIAKPAPQLIRKPEAQQANPNPPHAPDPLWFTRSADVAESQ